MELVLLQLVLVKDSVVSRHLSDIKLVQSNDLLIEASNLLTIVNLLLRIQVDGSIVHTQLVLPEEWDGDLLEVQEDNLSEHISAADFPVRLLKTLRQQRDSVHSLALGHQPAATRLEPK